MTTDLHTDDQLEQRLRAACHAVIPHLGESSTFAGDTCDHDAYDHDAYEVSTLATVTAFPTARSTGRTRLVGVAAAALLVAGGAAVWAAAGRPASDDAGTVAQSQPVLPTGVVATVLAPPTGSSVPCFDINCAPLDRLPVVAGTADFYVGPESLGTAVVNQEMLDQVGIIRCVGLTADGSACQRIEGIAGVGLVTYPTNIAAPSTVPGDQAVQTIEIEVGTTFTDVSPADYANIWGGIHDGANASPMVVRGHDGIQYHYAGRTYVVWQEQPGLLVWVAVPDEMADQLSTIADGVRRTTGPTTIPYIVVVTPLAGPWAAQDNNGDGLIYARVGGKLLMGIDYIDSTEVRTAVVARQKPGVDGELVVGGMAPVEATRVRITAVGSPPVIIDTLAFAGAPESRFFMANLPGGPGSVSVDWLAADGSELGGELAEAPQADRG